jgi:predicted ester cyclase
MDVAAADVASVAPLAGVLRRYAYAYTAAHDFAVCADIMVEDYTLLMGEHEIRGRDGSYIPATRRQFRQFPTLNFTVHDLLLGEDRAALVFSEHGYSTLHETCSAWTGVSLYRWDGKRLTECRVEQDYHARTAQHRSGTAHPVSAPGLDPWIATPRPAAPGVEEAVRGWLSEGGLDAAPVGCLDDEHCAEPARILLDDQRTTVLDLFAAGDRAAFHVRTDGSYRGGLPGLDGHVGRPGKRYASGIVTVDGGVVSGVRAVTDRIAAARRLTAG